MPGSCVELCYRVEDPKARTRRTFIVDDSS